MPLARRGPTGLVAMLLLAACAGQPGGGEEDGPASAAVKAFSSVCGPLSPQEVASRAGNLGFVRVDPSRQAAQGAPVDPNVLLMIRPQTVPGSLAAVLAFNPRGPTCELAVTGVETAPLEREFGRMIDVLSRQPNQSVQPATVSATQADAAAAATVRRAVLVVNQGAAGIGAQLVVLRVLPEGPAGQPPRAVLSLHVGRVGPAPGAIPPPAAASAPPRG